MPFLVARAVAAAGASSQDRADIFARGEMAVLVVADGAGGLGDGAAAADLVLERVRDAVLDVHFDLLAPPGWTRLFEELDRSVAKVGESTAVVVVLAPGLLVCCAAGDSEAWIVRPDDIAELTKNADRARLGSGRANPSATVRGDLDGRVLVASDGLFRHVASDKIAESLRGARFGGIADAVIELARLPSGAFADDVAVLVAAPGCP